MSLKHFPEDSFYEQIEKMTLLDLELFIEALCKNMEVNRHKIDACFEHRKYLLNDMFECTPENVKRLHCISNLLKNRTAMLCKKGNHLYKQMLRLWRQKQNEPFTDFRIDLSLHISYNYEGSILQLDDDNSGSNYPKMAELLDDFYYKQYSGNLIFRDTISYDTEKERQKWTFQFFELDGKIDNWGEHWFFEKFPTLRNLPVTYEFHKLLYHTNYSLQDIIRINDVWSEAKVVWQHIAGQ